MSAIEQPTPAYKNLADLIRHAGGPDLIALLKSIRPEYGAPGSRDQDVGRGQKEIDATVALLEGPAPAGWMAIGDAMAEEGDPLWLHTRYGKVIAGAKRWRQGWNPDYWETEDGELSFDEVTHWMRRLPPAAPRMA
jgi:hypothetical protein